MNSKASKLTMSYYGSSDIGMVRQENQDSFLKLPDNNTDLFSGKGQLFIVADGVGGHTGGKEASRMAVEIVGSYFNSADSIDKALLKKAFEKANAEIYDKASRSLEFNRMATTCSTLFLKENKGIISHIGDSRVYRISNNKIEQLTKDHTQVQELLSQGLLKKEEIESYPNKSVLLKAMGAESEISADIYDINIDGVQAFVLCSDGLAKVKEDEILNVVINNSPDSACKKLISLANERGGKDNVTVLVIKFAESEKTIPYKKKINPLTYIIPLLAAVIIAALIIWKEQIPLLTKDSKADTVKTNSALIPTAEQSVEENQELIKAEQLFAKGKIDNALAVYKSILEKEPMDLKAIKGINKVAEHYFLRAERLRKSNDIKGALKLYYKVNEIQPDHEMSNYYIELYRNH